MSRPTVLRLSNGIRVVAERVPWAHSVAFGLWLLRGSRHEGPRENGMTHFAEHLLFKGTRDRHWKDIARELNRLGGNFNACTSTDWVRLYGRVVSSDLPDAVRILCEMFVQSTFPPEEVDREREVIIEEIAEYEDTPEDVAFERFTGALFPAHPLGRPVIGTEDLVGGFKAGDLMNFWRGCLDPARLVISASGAVDIEDLAALLEKELGHLQATGIAPAPEPAVAGGHDVVRVDRDLEQVNFCLGMVGPSRRDPARIAWALYSTILGGGMGSRLFDEVREKRGLAYSIGSTVTRLEGCGILSISGSTRPDTAGQALDVCMEQIHVLAEEGPRGEELHVARRQIECSALLEDESLYSRADMIGEREIYGMPHLTTEEFLASLNAVTAEQVHAVARHVRDYGAFAGAVVGPLAKARLDSAPRSLAV